MSDAKFYARSIDHVWFDATDSKEAINEIVRGRADEWLGDVIWLDATDINEAIKEVRAREWEGDDPLVCVFDVGDWPQATVQPARPVGEVMYHSSERPPDGTA